MNGHKQALPVYSLQWQALLERDTANSRSNKLFGRSRNLRKIRSAVCQSIRIIRQLHWASGNFHIIQVSDSEQTHQETQLAHHPTRCIIECDDELYLGLLVTLQYSHLSAVSAAVSLIVYQTAALGIRSESRPVKRSTEAA